MIVVDSRVHLKLGAEISKRLGQALASHGDDHMGLFGKAPEIVAFALEGSDPETRETNAAVIIEFLQGEMTKLGLPTSSESMAILAEKAAVDARNKSVAEGTDDAIFRETFLAHMVQADFPRTPDEESEFNDKMGKLRAEAIKRFGTADELEAEARQRATPHSVV